MCEEDLVILSNQVECLSCGDKPYSASRHDFVSCSCGGISVDGGMDYLRRVGSNFKEMSISWPVSLINQMIEDIDTAKETGRSSYGIVCAVARTIRDSEHEVCKKEV